MMSNKRHKWNGKATGNGNEYYGGLAVACVKCGCTKEIVNGRPTYFINDSCYDKAPKCDERLLVNETKEI